MVGLFATIVKLVTPGHAQQCQHDEVTGAPEGNPRNGCWPTWKSSDLKLCRGISGRASALFKAIHAASGAMKRASGEAGRPRPAERARRPFLHLIKCHAVALLVIAVMPAIPLVILMIPMSFVQLPALPVVIIMRMVPVCPLIGRTVPAAGYPSIVTPVRGPVAVDPSVSWTWKGPAPLETQRRRCDSDVHPDLRQGRDGESGCQYCATYPIQSHSLSPVEYFGGSIEKLLPYSGHPL